MATVIHIVFAFLIVFFMVLRMPKKIRNLAAFLVGTAWVGTLYFMSLDGQYLRDHGIHTVAKVTKVECKSGNLYLSYSYNVKGRDFLVSHERVQGHCSSRSVGESIDIMYSPRDTSYSAVDRPNANSWGTAVGLFLLAYFGIVLGNAAEARRRGR